MQRRIWQRNPRWSLVAALVALGVGCSTRPAPAPAPPPAPVPVGTSRPITPPPVTAVAAPAVNLEALSDDLFDRTNTARRNAGLTGLLRSVNLMSAAQIQADQMVKAGRMEHELPGQDYPTLRSRFAAVQYAARAAGENIAEGQRTPAAVVTAWMDSSKHRANILSKEYTELGTGVAVARNGRLYFVAVFARPGTPTPARAARPD
jgi:uncharacterized protein YkwD